MKTFLEDGEAMFPVVSSPVVALQLPSPTSHTAATCRPDPCSPSTLSNDWDPDASMALSNQSSVAAGSMRHASILLPGFIIILQDAMKKAGMITHAGTHCTAPVAYYRLTAKS